MEEKGEYKDVLDGVDMSEDTMTVLEAYDLKMLLEQRIAEMVDEYERKTGLVVLGVDLSRDDNEKTVAEAMVVL